MQAPKEQRRGWTDIYYRSHSRLGTMAEPDRGISSAEDDVLGQLTISSENRAGAVDHHASTHP